MPRKTLTPDPLPRPEPVVVRTLCSLCGEDWHRHGADPTTLDCIRLLKARPLISPWWYANSTVNGQTNGLHNATISYLMPKVA